MEDREAEMVPLDRVLTRSDLAALGYPRRAVDSILRTVAEEGGGLVRLPGYSRPLVRAGDVHRVLEKYSFGDDEVHPGSRTRRR